MLKRTCKRTGPELRRFAHLSEQCTLKRPFISPGMQKIVFWCKSLNSKHPKVPIASRNIYKQYRSIAWQQLTTFDHEWYRGVLNHKFIFSNNCIISHNTQNSPRDSSYLKNSHDLQHCSSFSSNSNPSHNTLALDACMILSSSNQTKL